MKKTVSKLDGLLAILKEYISRSTDLELSAKANPKKWSKKEILGHLIDSGIHNLQRFTEVQFELKPYIIRHYNRDEFVKVNNYQNAEKEEILNFLLTINIRIMSLMKTQTPETLNFKVDLGYSELSDLRYLMTDYVEHFEHHINQIISIQTS